MSQTESANLFSSLLVDPLLLMCYEKYSLLFLPQLYCIIKLEWREWRKTLDLSHIKKGSASPCKNIRVRPSCTTWCLDTDTHTQAGNDSSIIYLRPPPLLVVVVVHLLSFFLVSTDGSSSASAYYLDYSHSFLLCWRSFISPF